MVGRLGIAAQDHHRQHGRQTEHPRPAPPTEQAVRRPEGQRQPGGADEVDHVAVLERHAAAEGVAGEQVWKDAIAAHWANCAAEPN